MGVVWGHNPYLWCVHTSASHASPPLIYSKGHRPHNPAVFNGSVCLSGYDGF